MQRKIDSIEARCRMGLILLVVHDLRVHLAPEGIRSDVELLTAPHVSTVRLAPPIVFPSRACPLDPDKVDQLLGASTARQEEGPRGLVWVVGAATNVARLDGR
eukprot:CAMPEP_0181184330 /NCGR_PEP_ID=MMETSP1096-20121128/8906_1 /TAXON_ID=156174 ORGANISM="Chrysochromulina ericina, Strain CCMP281" /NCGR_SAMPLE_ID=MMETSP1096 /ASSEMBLY_ACC=CAM_ASM_000453 /LENGTH=102 /DNA_ID=CAMNT_0023273079 /DNA_START=477 /DNA_END=781 /DNA_ORIENTATION=-